MVTVNENYEKLAGAYLFARIGKEVNEFSSAHPDRKIIRLGIGDVTQPLCPAVIEALQKAVQEMASADTFRGYAPDLGYSFLRQAMAENDYVKRGCDITADEIFISDGAKSDSANIQEIFGIENTFAVCDPVYPVYVDANVMAGRTGKCDPQTGRYEGVIYLPCTADNDFTPELPKEAPDLLYLCYPNNPTGAVISKKRLQEIVDYANKNGSIIIYDAAYEAYISDGPQSDPKLEAEGGVPHTIYECEGARSCAIELRSFSKNAGFTGLRLGATVIPKDVQGKVRTADGERLTDLHHLWARRHSTKFNGAPYIVQRAGEAVYSKEGQEQTKAQVAYYMKNARTIAKGLRDLGYTVYGGENAPYVWLHTPEKMTSWEFFHHLLEHNGVVGTPGSGFGAAGEHYFRLTGFGSYENTLEALERIRG